MADSIGPGGAAWKVNREAVLLLGGRRALLMQIAYPLIAAAVAEHSDFKRNPFGRLRRTMDLMFMLAFASVDQARQAYLKVDALHARVRGQLAQPAGWFAAGRSYDARDPELLFWVHATLVDTALLVYRRFVGDLTAAEQEQFYQQSKQLARLFRVPDSLIPAGLREFQQYMLDMVEVGPVQVGNTARELARIILYPPVPMVPSFAFDAINLNTIGLLPAALREQFGLSWNPGSQFLFDAWTAAIRTIVPMLPYSIRTVPAARAAEASRS